MKRAARSMAFLAGLIVGVAGCAPRTASVPAPAPSPAPSPIPKIAVIASFYPLYEFAARIGGERVEVRNLVPPGASAHDYEPTAKDVAALTATRLLIYNGAGFEPWVDRLLSTLPPSVERVDTTAGLPLVKGEHEHDHGHEKKGKKAEHDEKGSLDPHVWLDPVLAQQQADRIAAALAKVDPDRREAYEANAAALKADLQALDQRIADTLKTCRKRTVVTAHAAFGYFARRYGLRMIPIAGLSPEVEPSPARLRAILREVRKHGVRVIYYETLTSPKVAQTIAREVGAKTLVLNPVEGLTPDQRAGGATYFTVMDENLRNLADGLDCR